MLNDIDIYAIMSENWLVVTSFISGLLAGNPRIVKKMLGIFTFMFGLYRVYIFMRELKNPNFRRFLLKVFITAFLSVTALFFVLATNGCAAVPSHKDVMDDNFPVLNTSTLGTNNQLTVIPLTSKSASVIPVTTIDSYLDSFAKLATEIKVTRKLTNTKHKRIIADQDNAFKSERAAARKSLIVSCNIKISALRAENKVIAVTSLEYGNNLLKSIKGTGVTKKQVFKLPLNTCERYGMSFFFRLKQKGQKLSDKWLSCSKFPSIGLVSADKRNILVDLANTLKNKSDKFKSNYLDYYNCKNLSKTKYFEKLKLGLFPSRKLND